jgi:hypothetical protein
MIAKGQALSGAKRVAPGYKKMGGEALKERNNSRWYFALSVLSLLEFC